MPVSVIDLSVNLAVAQPRDDAAEDRERDADEERDERELERVLERRREEIPGRHLLRQRRSEVALEQPARPVDVLDEDRLVGPQLLVERVDGLLGGERAEHGAADVAGEDRRDPEDDHAEEEQRDQREADALEEEAGHRRSASS